jgi:hypothetical protein
LLTTKFTVRSSFLGRDHLRLDKSAQSTVQFSPCDGEGAAVRDVVG